MIIYTGGGGSKGGIHRQGRGRLGGSQLTNHHHLLRGHLPVGRRWSIMVMQGLHVVSMETHICKTLRIASSGAFGVSDLILVLLRRYAAFRIPWKVYSDA